MPPRRGRSRYFRQSQAKEKAHAGKGSRLTLESLQAADRRRRHEGAADHHQGRRAGIGRSAGRHADEADRRRRSKIRIIHSGVGAINESDVLLASASNAIIIGFNVRPDRNAADVAEREKVDIRLHSVIYNVTDEMKKAMAGLLDPTFKEVRIGTAEVRDTSRRRSSARSPAAWCSTAASRARATPRRGCCATTSSSTKARSARCAASRTTCPRSRPGSSAASASTSYNDIKVGDIIEAFVVERVATPV